MYNLYDKYLRGNSICCCPLYVSYYLLYVLTWELNRYGRTTTTTTTTHFKSFHCIDVMVPRVDSVLDANTNLELRILNANMNMMFDELWIDNQTITTYPFLHKKI
jgi:hypothetical protein